MKPETIENKKDVYTIVNPFADKYAMKDNNINDFDLYFLQKENFEKNKIYSPLSIKYALAMLSEGAKGESKKQIDEIIGKYSSKKYVNSENMSLANALFIKDSFKDDIKKDYISNLNNKFNAEVIYDSFASPDVLNNWVSDKTFNMINNLYDNILDTDFILVNALAIDMEWVNKIQCDKDGDCLTVDYKNEDYSHYVSTLNGSGYHSLKFNNIDNRKSAHIGASINKYDIVTELGESNIRNTVGKEYEEFLKEDPCGNASELPNVNDYLNQYIKDIDSNYKSIDSSTDFMFYDDENVKVFAKDLKKYNGTTLEYVGIMPKKESLKKYINSVKSEDINKLISSLKEIKLESFEEGVITEIDGYIPMFKFDYELELKKDLKAMGIKNVFNPNKADLSNLTTSKGSYISDAKHKANIEFSNEGIKAAAVTTLGGAGSAGCGFVHNYEVPVKKIDITFDNPYLFIIRDKESGEVWFTGTVYEPIEKLAEE